MALSAKTIVLSALLPLLLAPAARAEEAKPLPPGARCEGTLCDWYYSSRPAQPAAPANAAAASSNGSASWFGRSSGPKNAQPAEEPSSTNGYMSVGGGGLLGGKQERCEGTLCDVYYGSSSKGEAGGSAAGSQRQAAATIEPPVPHRHIVHESETRPKCAAPAADPWRCLR